MWICYNLPLEVTICRATAIEWLGCTGPCGVTEPSLWHPLDKNGGFEVTCSKTSTMDQNFFLSQYGGHIVKKPT